MTTQDIINIAMTNNTSISQTVLTHGQQTGHYVMNADEAMDMDED